MSRIGLLDAETLRKEKIPLREDLVHQEGQVRRRSWMCGGEDVEGKRASEGASEGEDKAKGIEGEGRNEEEGGEEEEEDPTFGRPQLVRVIRVPH
ncbi:hypothetical protein PIB30_086613 [Stylosanthes scabra]|uniref:Uncharacterized protein n=1 Tax=Stylosanthes scabra TaxID=79078 RepID=A0ABU6RTC6_9FABA|nr:hypothetical protein [Stylosanthes scabra]